MNIQARFDADLTIRSFAYVAEQLARSSAAPVSPAQYEQILQEAEKHLGALRLMQGDVFALTEQELREQALTKTEFNRLRSAVAQAITAAQQAISRIAAQYAPHRLAA